MEQTKKDTIIILTVIFILAICGFFYSYKIYVDTYFASSYLEIPTVNTTIQSALTNESHDIQLTIALDIDSTSSTLNKDYINTRVTKIVEYMDFDLLKGEEGFSYLLETIKKELGLDSSIIIDVYIVELQYDNAIQIKNESSEKNKRQSKIFESLFPNSK